ncbi:hypothetical protein HDU98_003399, partial [Podochytrium sp. JEL0797]
MSAKRKRNTSPPPTHPFFLTGTAAAPPSTPTVTWCTIDNALLVGESGAQRPSAKIAAFDFDGTITHTKGSHVFSTSPEDWRFVHPTNTKAKITQLVADGFRIVVISNQKGLIAKGKKTPKSGYTKEEIFKGKVAQVVAALGVPLLILAALEDGEYRKPQTGMWEYLVAKCNGDIQPSLSDSFYVGDAAGRPERKENGKLVKKDHSAGDVRMAVNLGIAFHVPEAFYEVDPNAANLIPKELEFDPLNWKNPEHLWTPSGVPLIPEGLVGPELVLLVGRPASGKTTFTKTHFLPLGYAHVNQDTLVDRKKCIAATIAALEAGKSVVVDNTNPSAAV